MGNHWENDKPEPPVQEWPSAPEIAHKANVSQALAHALRDVLRMQPSREASITRTKIEEAMMWLEKTS